MAAKRPQKKSPLEENVTMTGTIRIHPRGFGFVVPDDPKMFPEDVFIPKHLTDNAVDGDRVEVEINRLGKSEKGPDGKILLVLERGRKQVAGTISNTEGATLAHVPLLGPDRPVVVKDGKGKRLKVGDRLILSVQEWGNQKTPTICEVKKKIGHISDPSCDLKAAIEEYDLRATFPKKVIQEAKALGKTVTKNDLKDRLDLSKTPCITIDPDTAKDFDDALSISKDRKGHFFLGVHIADVAHYIPRNSALDQEAYERSNSTYFPGACVPMIPEELSNHLCSLKEGVIRLTVSVLMEFDPKGTLIDSQIKRSYIKSQKRFTYRKAKEILDGKQKSPHVKSLQHMCELSLLLKKKRNERGSVDFALPELVILVDKDGYPLGVKIEEYDITHQLVEEFMLKANEVVAKSLSDLGKGLLFRIHEEPDKENLRDFFTLARALGFPVPPAPTTEDIQALFHQAKQSPYSQQLAIGFIRNLKLAYYTPHNVGHFGLALEHYCHFTSPIRRYSDLITQRVLFNEEGKDLNLEKIGQHCSDQERKSFRAEMGVKKLKKLRVLEGWINDDPDWNYAARVTKIKPFGLFFEMEELFLEGFLHISELGNDFFNFDPKNEQLIGRTSGFRYSIGSEIQVRPVKVDLIFLETEWAISSKKQQKRKKR